MREIVLFDKICMMMRMYSICGVCNEIKFAATTERYPEDQLTALVSVAKITSINPAWLTHLLLESPLGVAGQLLDQLGHGLVVRNNLAGNQVSVVGITTTSSAAVSRASRTVGWCRMAKRGQTGYEGR